MEKLRLLEQDLINAICLFHAKFKNVAPEEIEVELMYDDVAGYSAEAFYNGQLDVYNTVNFITALRLYIDEQLGRDSMAARIVLDIDDEEGMIANVEF
ncbi:YxcD family protein [Solibacillus sp. MA9]|uniref:YxcD family protein n=1 Tax=Solibacillus palustris TaxID=2908203 RepID=A0ABS9UCK5_9BACL|nr:YxcD family protein [Solibacillus sp. MA9]